MTTSLSTLCSAVSTLVGGLNRPTNIVAFDLLSPYFKLLIEKNHLGLNNELYNSHLLNCELFIKSNDNDLWTVFDTPITRGPLVDYDKNYYKPSTSEWFTNYTGQSYPFDSPPPFESMLQTVLNRCPRNRKVDEIWFRSSGVPYRHKLEAAIVAYYH